MDGDGPEAEGSQHDGDALRVAACAAEDDGTAACGGLLGVWGFVFRGGGWWLPANSLQT